MAAYATALKHATKVGVLKSMSGSPIESIIEFASRVTITSVVRTVYGGEPPDMVTAFYIYATNNLGKFIDSDTFLTAIKPFVSKDELIRNGIVKEVKGGRRKAVELLDWNDRCGFVSKKRSSYLVDVLHSLLCASKEGKSAVESLMNNVFSGYSWNDICRVFRAIYANSGDETVKNFGEMFCSKGNNHIRGGTLLDYAETGD
jgi:hypothetical protein